MDFQTKHISVMGFEVPLLDTKPCDQTLEHDKPHKMYLVVNPEGEEEWVCEWLTTS